MTGRARTLAALAREAGVQRSYTDVGGQRRRAPDAALAAVLAALAIPGRMWGLQDDPLVASQL